MNKEDQYLADTYAKRNIEIVRGSGALVYDASGKEYFDCMTGNGVALLGHGNEAVKNRVREQLEKIITVPGLLYNDARAAFVEKLAAVTPEGMTKFFLANSGTESVEGAIKLARKHTGRTDIIAMKKGFHGRTLGALSATWKPKYRKGFEPLVPGFSHAVFGDLDSLKELLTEKTAAVILEPIQGEGGINLPTQEYLNAVLELCHKNGTLLIFDEVQTFGRTGHYFASQRFGVTPDIITTAKGIGGGVPIGVVISTPEIFTSLGRGDHGTTFGGNALSCAAGLGALEAFAEKNLIARGTHIEEYLLPKLKELESLEPVREARGIGAMLALEFRFPIKELLPRLQESGLLVLTCGRNIIRLLPPLVITDEQMDRVVEILRTAIPESFE